MATEKRCHCGKEGAEVLPQPGLSLLISLCARIAGQGPVFTTKGDLWPQSGIGERKTTSREVKDLSIKWGEGKGGVVGNLPGRLGNRGLSGCPTASPRRMKAQGGNRTLIEDDEFAYEAWPDTWHWV